ncbi:MAG TPA: 4Fe-4S binding protein [Bacillota bacterium]|nr:4Fe-4S binding protein [Bacillota bacterium]
MRRRHLQLLAAVAANVPLLPCSRAIPVPILHCHACPLATGACPVGTLQHFIILGRPPLFLLGIVGMVTALAGRATCAFLCPFGLVQEWLRQAGQKLGIRERRVSNAHAWTRWAVLGGLVVAAPSVLGEPWFCKLCPNGTLFAGIPLLILDPALRPLAGPLFFVKLLLAAGFIGSALLVRRPFCRFICPYGAAIGLGNRLAWSRIQHEPDQCTGCGSCRDRCPVDLPVPAGVGSSHCLQCRECAGCPAVKVVHGWRRRPAGVEGEHSR